MWSPANINNELRIHIRHKETYGEAITAMKSIDFVDGWSREGKTENAFVNVTNFISFEISIIYKLFFFSSDFI